MAGVGGIGLNGNVENSLNWAPRLGATYQLTQKTVLRAGYGRSYDIGVFGSLFGHAVTQNLPVLSNQNINAPNNFDAVFNLAPGAARAGLSGRAGRRPLPAAERLRCTRAQPEAAPARRRRLERDRPAPAHRHPVGRSGLRRQSRRPRVLRRQSRRPTPTRPSLVGFAQGVSTNLRRPFFAGAVANAQGFGGAFGWTQSFDYFCNCATNLYNSLQAKATKRFSQGYSLFLQYTLQHSENNDGDYYFIDPDREPRHGQLRPHAHLHVLDGAGNCRSATGRPGSRTRLGRCRRLRRRLAAQSEHDHPERISVQRDATGTPGRIATPDRTARI